MPASPSSAIVPEGTAGWRYSWDRYLVAGLLLAAIAYLLYTGQGSQMWRGYWAQRHLQAGAMALGRAEVDTAERNFKAAQRLASPQQNMAATIARVYLAAGMADAARPYLKNALGSTRDPLLLAVLGSDCLQSGRPADAEAAFAKALETGAADAEVLNTVGYAYAVAGIQLEQAERLLKRALELKPRAPHIVDSLGWAYFKMGRLEEAVPLLEQAAKAMPAEPEILSHLRLARRALHQQEATAARAEGARK